MFCIFWKVISQTAWNSYYIARHSNIFDIPWYALKAWAIEYYWMYEFENSLFLGYQTLGYLKEFSNSQDRNFSVTYSQSAFIGKWNPGCGAVEFMTRGFGPWYPQRLHINHLPPLGKSWLCSPCVYYLIYHVRRGLMNTLYDLIYFMCIETN